MTSWAKHQVINVICIVAFVTLCLFLVYIWKQYSPNRNDAKLKELRALSSETPAYPDFREVAMHFSSRAMDAGVYRSYYSLSGYEEVKRFYLNILSKRGWKLTSEESSQSFLGESRDSKKIAFRKNDLQIIVEYVGGIAPNEGRWNYSVSFIWRNNSGPTER
jgi:hypothetical protein